MCFLFFFREGGGGVWQLRKHFEEILRKLSQVYQGVEAAKLSTAATLLRKTSVFVCLGFFLGGGTIKKKD